jgi:catechol 2,3-dioxygenase
VTATATIPAQTTIGRVDLTVADAATLRDFYERVVGLRDPARLVGLHEQPGAPPPDPRATGLFHMAILVPTRRDLALALARIGQAGWPLSGASDHLVSEAIYLRDPEGNGIEIYRDRPREEWGRSGDGIRIDTLPLDLEDVLGELSGDGTAAEPGPMPPETRMGHVHLKVADLAAAEEFYVGVLGFEVTARAPGATFVSAGGYHHHVGFNVWSSSGGPPPPPGSRGLRSYQVRLPGEDDLEAMRGRVEAAGAPVEVTDAGVLTADPSGNHLLLSTG